MPQNERDALISGIIDKIIKAESEGKTSEYADRANIGQYYENERRFQDNIAQEGKWYFYNQTALTFGRTEFRRRWGERRLEDNWRRSNRNRVSVQQASAGQDENGKAQTDTVTAVMDYKKPEYYLKNLPMNDSLFALSNDKIATAYFNAGKIFSERISDNQKAAESYEKLLSRFPDNDLIPEALYDLYKLYKEGNNQKSEIARQKLLEKYPASEFSKIISDPDYYNKKMAEIRLFEKLYQDAYNFYALESFKESISVCDSAIKKSPADNLAPKFMLLRAYSVAKISDERRFKEELNKLVKVWPELPELKIEEDKEIASELYIADTTALYSFEVIIMDPSFNINQASFDVISYNIDNYTNKNYRTEGILVDNKYIQITISGFADNTQAWEYYNSFRPEKLIRNVSGAEIMTFLINNENLKKLEEDKNPQRYYLFFNENYLTGKKNR
jgi:tetratricopeptide (TPR) repeat protein